MIVVWLGGDENKKNSTDCNNDNVFTLFQHSSISGPK